MGNQRGNPLKSVRLMIELVKGTGVVVGKRLPTRMPIGPDGFSHIRKKCEDTLKIYNEWESLGKLTDLEPAA